MYKNVRKIVFITVVEPKSKFGTSDLPYRRFAFEWFKKSLV